MYHQIFGQAKSAVACDQLHVDQLKELLNDDEKLEERVNSVLKVLEQEKHIIIAQNRNIAEDNVTKEPEIVERKSRMSELSEQGKTICSSIQDKLNQIISKKGDAGTTLALLQAAAAESEEKSEKVASKFQDKEITIDEYLEQFMAERKLMHLRKLKIEKMAEIMKKSSQPNNHFAPTINFYPYKN